MKALLDPIDGIITGVRETIFGIPAWFLGVFCALHAGFALASLDVRGRWESYSFSEMVGHIAFCWLELILRPAGIIVLLCLLLGLATYAFSTRYRTVAFIASITTGIWHGIFLFRDNSQTIGNLLFGAEPTPMGHIGISIAILLTLITGITSWGLLKNTPTNPITG